MEIKIKLYIVAQNSITDSTGLKVELLEIFKVFFRILISLLDKLSKELLIIFILCKNSCIITLPYSSLR